MIRHLHRHPAHELLLHRDAEVPIRRTNAPALEEIRVVVVREDVLTPTRVGDRPAQIATDRTRRSWFPRLLRSQSGTKSLSASTHVRVTPCTPKAPVDVGMRSVGLELA